MSQTINYLRAALHRAQLREEKTVTISVLDLAEILPMVESYTARAKVEFGGQHFGFCRPENIRQMCNGERFRISVRRKKNDEFNTSVCFTELPPRAKEVTDGTETSLLPAPPVCEPPVG